MSASNRGLSPTKKTSSSDDGRYELGEILTNLSFLKSYLSQFEEVKRLNDENVSGLATILEEYRDRVNIDELISDGQHVLSNLERFRSVLNDISGIGKEIKEISTQVNLLSINAAIEAAHAKEAGRGFAVVADEIKKLSDRTRKSVEEIDRTISSIRSELQRVTENMTVLNGRMGEMQSFGSMLESQLLKMKETMDSSLLKRLVGVALKRQEHIFASFRKAFSKFFVLEKMEKKKSVS